MRRARQQALLNQMLPSKVMEMLDRLYNVPDNLALRHQLFKVETIGCTHTVVGNLQKPSTRPCSQGCLVCIGRSQSSSKCMHLWQRPHTRVGRLRSSPLH
ncbi:TPA: Guanylate cyclase soluble subunit alpha-2 [Trebouxia sp. C0004]